jgi:hypothetical protein
MQISRATSNLAKGAISTVRTEFEGAYRRWHRGACQHVRERPTDNRQVERISSRLHFRPGNSQIRHTPLNAVMVGCLGLFGHNGPIMLNPK